MNHRLPRTISNVFCAAGMEGEFSKEESSVDVFKNEIKRLKKTGSGTAGYAAINKTLRGAVHCLKNIFKTIEGGGGGR